MDPTVLLPFQRASTDPFQRDLSEIDAAIELVTSGAAARVRLVALVRPEAIAAEGLARAQTANVRFTLDRGSNGVAAITIGPARSSRAGRWSLNRRERSDVPPG